MGGHEPALGTSDERALTPIVAVLVLVGLVVTSAVAVFVAGSGALFAMQDQSDVEQATDAMEQLSHDVHSGHAGRVALPHDGDAHVDSSAGELRVLIENDSGGVWSEHVELGTLYYDSGDTRLAFQGGGVWRTDAGPDSTMVSAPPVQYNAHGAAATDPTLTFPVVSVQGPDGPYDGGELSTNESATRRLAERLGDQRRLVNETLVIEVESEFYLAWADYFEERFQPEAVTRVHARDVARVNLTGATRVPGDTLSYNVTNGYEEVEGIVGFLMNDGPLLHPRQGLTIDSYNSEVAPYDASVGGHNGSIISDGDVEIANEVKIYGDVVASGQAKFSNDVEVTGSTLVGATSGLTHVDTSGSTTFHGLVSTHSDLEVGGGVTFHDHVIVGGDLEGLEGDVGGSVFVHGDIVDDDEDFEGRIEGDLVVVGANGVDPGNDSDFEVGGEVLTDLDSEDVPPPMTVNVSAMDRDVDLGDVRTNFESSNDNCGSDDVGYATGYWEDDPCDDWDDPYDDPYGGGYYDPYRDPYGSYGGYGGSYDDPYADSSHDPPEEPAKLTCGSYGDPCRLEAGNYYLESIELSGYSGEIDDLVLDTSDGPINIFVEGTNDGAVDVNKGGSIEVKADADQHPVTIYSADTFRVREGGEITVPHDRTSLFKVYMHPESLWRVSGGSTFQGAVFGLRDGGQRTEIDLSGGRGSAVYGAMLGDIQEMDQRGTVHYDEALAEVDVPDPELDYDGDERDGAASHVEDPAGGVEYLHFRPASLQG